MTYFVEKQYDYFFYLRIIFENKLSFWKNKYDKELRGTRIPRRIQNTQ